MNNTNTLSQEQIMEINRLARNHRREFGFLENAPIGNDIFTIYEKLDIILLEYPIPSEGDRPAFSAVLFYSEEGDQKLVFVGLNTADYFDKQIFALTHELYHFFYKENKHHAHISRLEESPNTLSEQKANRFAAEFLLPEESLKDIILKEFKSLSLKDVSLKAILRFIARQQCTWWLPYRSVVRRLQEINAITSDQYDELYAVQERMVDGEYYRMGMAINSEDFRRLNQQTHRIGTFGNELEVIIRNFEDGVIDEEHFADTLALFNLKPEDFGYPLVNGMVVSDTWDDFSDEDDKDED